PRLRPSQGSRLHRQRQFRGSNSMKLIRVFAFIAFTGAIVAAQSPSASTPAQPTPTPSKSPAVAVTPAKGSTSATPAAKKAAANSPAKPKPATPAKAASDKPASKQ